MIISSSAKEPFPAFEPSVGIIYSLDELDSLSMNASCWTLQAVRDVTDNLRHDGFPCLFGRKAFQDRSIRFLFCGDHQRSGFHNLFDGVRAYTEFTKSVPQRERLFSPLVVVFNQTSENESRSCHEVAWEALNFLHRCDPVPWPSEVPLEPDDPGWAFCFNGVQLFINISAPDHTVLRNRNLGRYLTLVINPRENFDAVASIHTRSGRLVRQRIRERLGAWNFGIVPPELGFYGEHDNLEWKQYQLEEPDLPRPEACPFRPKPNVRGAIR